MSSKPEVDEEETIPEIRGEVDEMCWVKRDASRSSLHFPNDFVVVMAPHEETMADSRMRLHEDCVQLPIQRSIRRNIRVVLAIYGSYGDIVHTNTAPTPRNRRKARTVCSRSRRTTTGGVGVYCSPPVGRTRRGMGRSPGRTNLVQPVCRPTQGENTTSLL